MKTDYDVLIIGSGASGGMAAYTLTQLGARCLMLDAGPPLDFDRGRTLRPVWDLPYRGFGRPGRFPHITRPRSSMPPSGPTKNRTPTRIPQPILTTGCVLR
jgi:choline dehydrogenase-like flavoprotein